VRGGRPLDGQVPVPEDGGRLLAAGRLHQRQGQLSCRYYLLVLVDSVPDLDPDPHVFGPPGSGSISKMYGSGSGSFYNHAKIVRKPLIPTIL
jgi:hypothetical protein